MCSSFQQKNELVSYLESSKTIKEINDAFSLCIPFSIFKSPKHNIYISGFGKKKRIKDEQNNQKLKTFFELRQNKQNNSTSFIDNCIYKQVNEINKKQIIKD